MFSVTATGTGLTYQWRKDGVNLSNTPAISGVYTSTLTINNIQTANEGTYDVVVSGTCVPATSNGAVLAVDDKPVITLQPEVWYSAKAPRPYTVSRPQEQD